MSTLEEKIAIMQAALDGAEIEVDFGDGWEVGEHLTWDWIYGEYRIKPQPKEIWVNEYNNCPALVFHSQDEAEQVTGNLQGATTHYREVME